MRRSSAVLLLEVACLCLMIQGVASAQEDFDKKRGGPQVPTLLELKSLPPVCTLKVLERTGRADPEEVKKWTNILGNTYIHMHHYCNGLNFLNRMHNGTGDRATLLGLALGEFIYMQNNIPADHVLRPELEFNIGQVLYEEDQIPEAVKQTRKVIQLKPDYVNAYILLSFCYLRLGDYTSAADALGTGLIRVPDSRSLRDALDDVNSRKKELNGARH